MFNNNSIFEKFQSGFHKLHSSDTALLRVTNDLLMAAYSRHCSVLVLLDISAAFDAIDHAMLINRLKDRVGNSGTALEWFSSYLSYRKFYVSVDSFISSTAQTYGLPQGPVLFFLYMLPLDLIIPHYNISFHCDADDTQL